MNSVVIAIILASCIISIFATASKRDTVPDLIRKKGYPCEIHYVTTSDGYILTVHRIPHGKALSSENSEGRRSWWRNKVPVLMQHGLLSSSASWVLNTPHKAPAYLMVDAGYDVWLTNSRGSTYSKNHTHLSPKSKEFWQFSWDEMAYYDFPAFVSYILNATEQEQLYYIGHSMGTTIYFAAVSRRPEFNSKIKKMYALGPVAYAKNVRSYVAELSHISEEIELAMYYLGIYEFLPQSSLIMKLVRASCGLLQITQCVCENLLFLITGFDRREFNSSWIPEITDELLSGTSFYTILHYSQEYLSGKFRRYDYGYYKNMDHYGQHAPPDYDLEKVTSEVNAIWGLNDYLADVLDVNKLIANLPNRGALCVPVRDENFNHLDFLWAKEAKRLVYDPIIEDMMKGKCSS